MCVYDSPSLLLLPFLPLSPRLHMEQTRRSADAALWEGLHCDERAGRPSRGCGVVQIPLREAQNVCWRWNTQPLPRLWGPRGRNGKFWPKRTRTHSITHTLSWLSCGSHNDDAVMIPKNDSVWQIKSTFNINSAYLEPSRIPKIIIKRKTTQLVLVESRQYQVVESPECDTIVLENFKYLNYKHVLLTS